MKHCIFVRILPLEKKVFIPLSKTHSNPEEALQAQKELRELELNWHMKLFEMQREEKRR